MTLVSALAVAVLVGAGTWMMLHRDNLRAVLGASLLGHGVVLLLVLQGGAGRAPLVGGDVDPDQLSDPLPQALGLTAIVIGFGITAYLLALAAARSGDDE